MEEIATVAFGYLVGSIPFAYLLARRRGFDLRRVGSGNVGATNVMRISGARQGVLAMVLDGAKGACAVLLAGSLATSAVAAVAAGLAAVIGHIYPVWLGFRGGKGVATAAGVFSVLAPSALGIASAVFLFAVWTTRFISVGSIAGAIALAVSAAAGDAPAAVGVGAVVAALIIIHRHRENLARLMSGTERRVGQRL